MTETIKEKKKRGPKRKSSFYHTRWNVVGLNEERTAEILAVSIDDVKRYDMEGAPEMAEKLLQLWDRKHVGIEGWDGWTFRRGLLSYGKSQWTPKMILDHRNRAEEVFRLREEIQELKTWRGLSTIFVEKLVDEVKKRRRFSAF